MKFSKYFAWAAVISVLFSCGNNSTESATVDTSSMPADTVSNAVSTPSADPGFLKTVSYKNFSFTVKSDGSDHYTVTPSGYSATNEPFTAEMQGKIEEVKVNDITGDDMPELAIITGGMPDSARVAHVFSSNGNKSFGPVNFPELPADAKKGYHGNDTYEFVENSFIRRFPTYDAQLQPTGKYRQLQYKMENGEAMKQLVLSKSVDF